MLDEPGTFASGSQRIRKRLGSKIVQMASRAGFLYVYDSLRSRLVKRQVAILCYHRVDNPANYPWSVTPVTPEVFDLEMNYLRRKHQIISLEELSTALGDFKALPPRPAVITFDDGYRDVYVNAYPILKKYGSPATVFLATGHIGTGKLFWFDKVRYVISETKLDTIELGELGTYYLSSAGDRRSVGEAITARLKQITVKDRDEFIEKLVRLSGVDVPLDLGRELMLSWDEIKEMSRNGINFGAHTVNHPILTRLPLEMARKEILDSKQQIEKELGQAVTTFCYPNGGPGDFNSDIEEILRNNGFKCAVTLNPAKFVSLRAQPYRLPRIHVEHSFDMFELLMSGLYFDVVARCGKLGR